MEIKDELLKALAESSKLVETHLKKTLYQGLYGVSSDGEIPDRKPEYDFKIKHNDYGRDHIVPADKTDYHCANCGAEGLYVDTTGGDYYMGETYYCLVCEHKMYLPMGTEPVKGLEVVG